ncbi:ATP-binding protein [Intrasporangium calvum]|uniref:Transcriptional regulator, LuxR family n=1 Tax=Intrasporangium calvum (strain ATCC 23552 / DSM 43043 / JCM 3097 / NBRC 12989 / NCIMB 10167 / NRRL B-3866 / 7 KIP) TaxID=710696 RepID=E6S7R9_INTC7|nr:AAA family ATPase [Intrasporangium calvum]ADU47976.1 transcriptional regulator, LuxR family [Intrasporangium calvum DSM 43043]
MLVERDHQLHTLGAYLDEAAAGHGRLIYVSGEAGIGKSALVNTFTASAAPQARAAVAYCDGSLTPSPLAPLRELLPTLPPGLWPDDATRQVILTSLLGALREPPGSVPYLLVVEDAHWADQATLDLLLHLARRIHTCRALVVVTYRREDVDAIHGLRQLLGDSASATGTRRLDVPPLSRDAVATLVARNAGSQPLGSGVDVTRLHEITHGNAFYVTEVLSSGLDTVPEQCRDAILARVANLPETTQQALEVVALAGARAEVDLLEELLRDGLAALDDALARGLLVEADGAVTFRHELARIVVAEQVPIGRRIHQHRRLLAALEARGADPARLAHHADAAGLSQSAVAHATVAGRRASDLGAHREAARQFERALAHAARLHGTGLPDEQIADLYWSLGYELYVTGRIGEASVAVEEARDLWEAQGATTRVGDAWRCLSRLLWFEGRNADAEAAAEQALDVLEGPPTPELAYAYSNMTQLRMLTSDSAATRTWGARTLSLLDSLEEGRARTELRAHALNNLGTIEVVAGDRAAGIAMLEESLDLSRRAEMHEHAARAYLNLASSAIAQRRHDDAQRSLAEGIEYCTERDLDSWTNYLLGCDSELQVQRGDLGAAERSAETVLAHPSLASSAALSPLVSLAHVRGQRGEGGYEDLVTRAAALAEGIGEVQAVAPVAALRSELSWLARRDADAGAIATTVVELVERADCPWNRGSVLRWLPQGAPGTHREVAPPFAAELAGEWAEAARLWESLGCPFDEALALARSGDADALTRAAGIFDEIKAHAGAARCRADLRSLGRTPPRAPGRTTRDHPDGLTRRESEVAALLARGLSDSAIAERLVISRRTAEHHVSSILAKVGVGSRRDLAEWYAASE